jgi:hypothetical protein
MTSDSITGGQIVQLRKILREVKEMNGLMNDIKRMMQDGSEQRRDK